MNKLIEKEYENFFTQDLCINKDNEYGTFVALQSGGRMFPFKDNQILFTQVLKLKILKSTH